MNHFELRVSREPNESVEAWAVRALRLAGKAARDKDFDVRGVRVHGLWGPQRPATAEADVLVVTMDTSNGGRDPKPPIHPAEP